jgi:hypothetical protein
MAGTHVSEKGSKRSYKSKGADVEAFLQIERCDARLDNFLVRTRRGDLLIAMATAGLFFASLCKPIGWRLLGRVGTSQAIFVGVVARGA